MCCVCVLDSIFCRKMFNTLNRDSNFNSLYIIKICIITFLLKKHLLTKLITQNIFICQKSVLHTIISSYLKEI